MGQARVYLFFCVCEDPVVKQSKMDDWFPEYITSSKDGSSGDGYHGSDTTELYVDESDSGSSFSSHAKMLEKIIDTEDEFVDEEEETDERDDTEDDLVDEEMADKCGASAHTFTTSPPNSVPPYPTSVPPFSTFSTNLLYPVTEIILCVVSLISFFFFIHKLVLCVNNLLQHLGMGTEA